MGNKHHGSYNMTEEEKKKRLPLGSLIFGGSKY